MILKFYLTIVKTMNTLTKKVFSFKPEFFSQDFTLLLFRILVSLSMINTHGLKKIKDFEGTIAHIPDPLGVGGEVSAIMAIIANIIAPIFIIFGFATRLAILPILAVTLMGFFIVHGNDPLAIRDVPAMYSLVFIALLLLGPGKYSIDHKIFK